MSKSGRRGIGASGSALFGCVALAGALFACSRTGFDDLYVDPNGTVPAGTQDAASPPLGEGGGDDDGDAGNDAAVDANADTNVAPVTQVATCGGVCGGVTLPSTGDVTLANLGGRWVFCGGFLPALSLDWDGFPPDTAGFDFDPHTSVATLLVAGADGELEPGVGEQYTWPVSVADGESGITYTGLLFIFQNAFSAAYLGFAPTWFPSGDGCTAALNFVLYTGEMPNLESSWTFAGDP